MFSPLFFKFNNIPRPFLFKISYFSINFIYFIINFSYLVHRIYYMVYNRSHDTLHFFILTEKLIK